MAKIKVRTPLVEMDGDEMTRVIWAMIKEKLILPFLDIELKYYDLGSKKRDETDDKVTIDAANAIKEYGVGVKCATITPDSGAGRGIRAQEGLAVAQRHHPWHPRRHRLPQAHHGEEHLARGPQLENAHRHRPPRLRRHLQGVEFVVPRPGQGRACLHSRRRTGESACLCTSSRAPAWSWACTTRTNRSAPSPSPASPTRSRRRWISGSRQRHHQQAVPRPLQGHLRPGSCARKAELDKAGIDYRYLLIDDAVAQMMKHDGGILWACRNYDGDVLSDMVASGFGSLGMMTSVLVSPDGKFEYEAAHGTVRRHYYEHLKGNPTSTNPVASIFAWTGALRKRGELDGTPEVEAFADAAGSGGHRLHRGRHHHPNTLGLDLTRVRRFTLTHGRFIDAGVLVGLFDASLLAQASPFRRKLTTEALNTLTDPFSLTLSISPMSHQRYIVLADTPK